MIPAWLDMAVKGVVCQTLQPSSKRWVRRCSTVAHSGPIRNPEAVHTKMLLLGVAPYQAEPGVRMLFST